MYILQGSSGPGPENPAGSTWGTTGTCELKLEQRMHAGHRDLLDPCLCVCSPFLLNLFSTMFDRNDMKLA